jgi:hypothetical protein
MHRYTNCASFPLDYDFNDSGPHIFTNWAHPYLPPGIALPSSVMSSIEDPFEGFAALWCPKLLDF